jgi:hypothetical protein
MSWERGRADIERLIADGELERVTPSDEVARRLLADAEAHIGLASKGVEDDQLAPSSSATTPRARHPPGSSPSKASGPRPAAATSP